MRTSIYRNLDQPILVLGLSPQQIVFLSVILVLGGELARSLDISRFWSFFLFVILVALEFGINRWLGPQFSKRFIRFLGLPDKLPRKIVSKGRWL